MEIVNEGKKDLMNVFGRFKRRDFGGTGGQVIKNSSYTLSMLLIGKIGSFIFMIILARMLLPELFGYYSLALATILMFTAFNELGFGKSMITFVSYSLNRGDKKKAKTYFLGIMKYKIYFIIISSLALLAGAYFISNNYYHKPIFYALLAGGLYIPINSILGYFVAGFQAKNSFREPMIKEIIFQILRIIFIPIFIFYLLKLNLKSDYFIALIILALSFTYGISFLYLKISSKRKFDFLKEKKEGLTKKEKNNLRKFIFPLAFMAFSGMFFGYIDVLMLGRYVLAEYIGYYGIAFGFVGSIAAVVAFLPGSVLPIFSRIKGNELENKFKKLRKILALISFGSIILTYLVAPYVLLIYGKEYLPALPYLQVLSFLIFFIPETGLYVNYFMSRKKTKIIAVLLIFSTVVNIILNYTFIKYGLQFGVHEAVLGACIATVISKSIYFFGLVISKVKFYKNS